jgi:triphosphatase
MADQPREVELKLVLDPDAAGRLRAHALFAGIEAGARDQKSVYFDTTNGLLRKAGFTLRIRTTEGRRVQTIKAIGASAGLFDRLEWERPVDGELPTLATLAGAPLEAAVPAATLRKLKPRIVSTVRRTRWDLGRDDAAIEAVLDEGTIEAEGRAQPLCELELELASGAPDALFAAARALAADLPLRIGVLSKAEQGLALADGTAGKVAKAEPLVLSPDMDVTQGFAAIVAACLRHFRRNEDLVCAGRDASALHQARVAMRRLRSALSLFAPIMRREGFAELREELRWFTASLGDARNLDVYLAGADLPEAARDSLCAPREQAYGAVVAAASSPRFRRLTIDLVAWSATGPWRARRRARAPLPDFAAARLDRLWEKVASRGASLADLDEEARHRLRIEVKKLRYAVEFVASLYADAPRRKRFRDALEALQESLGHLNDIATARLLPERYGIAAAPPPANVGAEQAGHLAESVAAFARLRRTGPFWHARQGPHSPI